MSHFVLCKFRRISKGFILIFFSFCFHNFDVLLCSKLKSVTFTRFALLLWVNCNILCNVKTVAFRWSVNCEWCASWARKSRPGLGKMRQSRNNGYWQQLWHVLLVKEWFYWKGNDILLSDSARDNVPLGSWNDILRK